jgi:HTH-type transcriptional regulator/antitoxin HipB
MDSSTIAEIVLLHRKAAGITQLELATLAGVGKTVVFDIEKGKPTVRFDSLLKVFNVLNISIELKSKHLDTLQHHENS